MKKLSCILLAVMLITAMFVSCTAEVIDPYDGLAYVTFGGPASKDLSASYEVQSYEDLYWFYTATKTDAYGKTGETKVETPLAVENNNHMKGLGGKIGPFSQGTWKFELFAYSNSTKADGTLVYKGSVEGIKLTSSSLTSVPVSVTPQGDYGTIEFRNASFKWAGTSGEGKPTIKITAVGPQTYTLLSGLENVDESGNVPLKWKDDTLSIDQSYKNVAAGYYKCTVVAWVVDESSPIFEQNFGIRVYGSATTVISGDITEKVDSFVDFEVGQEDLVVFKGASTMEVLSTPSNASDKFTTVDFGSNLDGNTTYSLSVKSTTAAEAASKFIVSDGEASVAGIDLTLTTNNTPVTSFGSEITITTYITAGLDKDSVKVLYGNEGKNYLTDYDSTTGKLVFKTNHFSEYYVVSNAVAKNTTADKKYATLQDAIDNASDGDEIKLLSDVVLKDNVVFSQDYEVTLNMGGKKILLDVNPNAKTAGLLLVKGKAKLVIKGAGSFDYTSEYDNEGIGIGYLISVIEDAELTVEDGSFNGCMGCIRLGKLRNVLGETAKAYIKGGSFKSAILYPNDATAHYWTFNKMDGTDTSFVITGGIFYKFNPAKGGTENPDEDWVADGYCVSSEEVNGEIWYTVKNAVAEVGGLYFTFLSEAINAAKPGDIVTMLCDSNGMGLSSADVTSKELKENPAKKGERGDITVDFAGYTYTMLDPAVGSDGTETQAMHWGISLNSITMKNGTFRVAEGVKEVAMAMQNYVGFTAENMTFDFTNIPVVSYGENEFSGDYAIYNGRECPLFNNNAGAMFLNGCTIKMPVNSTKGISADGDGVALKDTKVDGYVNLQDSNSKLMTIGSSSVKGVVSYFGNGTVKKESSDGVTTYTLSL